MYLGNIFSLHFPANNFTPRFLKWMLEKKTFQNNEHFPPWKPLYYFIWNKKFQLIQEEVGHRHLAVKNNYGWISKKGQCPWWEILILPVISQQMDFFCNTKVDIPRPQQIFFEVYSITSPGWSTGSLRSLISIWIPDDWPQSAISPFFRLGHLTWLKYFRHRLPGISLTECWLKYTVISYFISKVISLIILIDVMQLKQFS